MKRLIVLILFVAFTAACTTSQSIDTGDTGIAVSVDALRAPMVRAILAEAIPNRVFEGVDQTEAECITDGWLSTLGPKALEDAGVTIASPKLRRKTLSIADAQTASEVIYGCIEIGIEQTAAGNPDLTELQRECWADFDHEAYGMRNVAFGFTKVSTDEDTAREKEEYQQYKERHSEILSQVSMLCRLEGIGVTE